MAKTIPEIEFRGFEKHYGKIHAVKPLDLQIETGETFALLGPNGSGKSTVIRALAGLHYPSAGKILINGKDIFSKRYLSHRKIAYMPQRVSMPEQLTAREILTFFAEIRNVNHEKIDQVLELVALEEDANRKTREYSGGMLQRLGLAAVFLEEVSILVLDEPTLNLDTIGIERFRLKIKEFQNQGTTILFSSHIIQDAAFMADRVGIMVDGSLVKVDRVPLIKSLISQQTSVRIVLHETSQNIFSAAKLAGAEMISCNGQHYSFKAPPDRRLKIIRAIESAGGLIEEFHTEAPDWESLIQKSFMTEVDSNEFR